MKCILPKNLQLRLDPKCYAELRRQILERDNWQCQVCGSMQHLEVHHIQFRSHSGPDSEQNLITLCANCHTGYHRAKEGRMRFPTTS